MESKPKEVHAKISTEVDEAEEIVDESLYFTGWRLHGISLWLLLSLFIAQMDTSVTSTAILKITDQLGNYEMSSWVFTSYLLTFCAFQLIWAKLSDIITRKMTILLSVLTFTIFSGACGASQTLLQLIMFRWLQGIGGCGIFALTQLVFFELVPPRKWPLYMSLVTGVIALSLVLGPLIGGAIAETGRWRWIFLLNIPICAVAMVGLVILFPAKLWNETSSRDHIGKFSMRSLRRIDVIGSTLLLGACVLLATGLQQAALDHPWTSGYVLPLLLIAAPVIVAFFAWEWFITTRRSSPEPVFPWRFCQSRVRMGMIINTYLSGTILTVCLVQIPQRFMTVNGLSALAAAIRVLPFGAFVPGGSSIGAALIGKFKIPPIFVVLTGAVLQLVGSVLFSRIPTDYDIHQAQYGYQVMLGIGVGFIGCGLVLLVPYVMEKRDLAVGTASISQFRTLGGLIGIAIATSVSTPYLRTHLGDVIPPRLVVAVLERVEVISTLSPGVRGRVMSIFGDSFNLQATLLIGFAAAQLPITAMMWTNQLVK